jgi:hypothetical protein
LIIALLTAILSGLDANVIHVPRQSLFIPIEEKIMPIAFEVVSAITLPAASLERHEVKTYVAECRDGNYEHVVELLVAVRSQESSVGDLGLTTEELERFRVNGLVPRAQAACQSVLNGVLYRQSEPLSAWLELGLVEYDELPCSHEALQDGIRSILVDEGREILEECHKGTFDRFERLRQTIASGVELAELGSSVEELIALKHGYQFSVAAEIAAECREGDFRRLPDLTSMVRIGEIDSEQVAMLDIDLSFWHHRQDLLEGKVMVMALRTGYLTFPHHHTTRPLSKAALRRVRADLQELVEDWDKNITPADLGLTDRAYRRLINPHPIRKALALELNSLALRLHPDH